MDASLSRASIPEGEGCPHDWNSYDHYRTIHEIRLAQHPFVDHDTPNTIVFDDTEFDDVITQRGRVYCLRGVVLEVDKRLRVSYSRTGQRRVRGFSYRYAAWVLNLGPVLRYHNLHADNYYHHRVFNPHTGKEIFYEKLQRHQFPVFSEVLDELEILTRSLEE